MDDDMMYYAFQVLFWRGIRTGELRALTLSDIDFYNNVLYIRNSYSASRGTQGKNKTVSEPFICRMSYLRNCLITLRVWAVWERMIQCFRLTSISTQCNRERLTNSQSKTDYCSRSSAFAYQSSDELCGVRIRYGYSQTCRSQVPRYHDDLCPPLFRQG